MAHVIVSSDDPMIPGRVSYVRFNSIANPALAIAFESDARFRKGYDFPVDNSKGDCYHTTMSTNEILDFLTANGCRIVSAAGTKETWIWTLVMGKSEPHGLVPGHAAQNHGRMPEGVGQQMPNVYFLPVGGGFGAASAQQSMGVRGDQQALTQQRTAGMEPAVQRAGIDQAMLVQQQHAAAIASQQQVAGWLNAGGNKITPNMRIPEATGPQGGPHKFDKQHHNQTPPQSILIQGQEPLTLAMLARISLQEQKQLLGERLFPLISGICPDLAGKVLGMLLEMENSEILHMLENAEALRAKVDKALDVIRAYKAKAAKKEG